MAATINLSSADIQKLREAVKRRENEIFALRRRPLSDFGTEEKLADEIYRHQVMVNAFVRLINIHEQKQSKLPEVNNLCAAIASR